MTPVCCYRGCVIYETGSVAKNTALSVDTVATNTTLSVDTVATNKANLIKMELSHWVWCQIHYYLILGLTKPHRRQAQKLLVISLQVQILNDEAQVVVFQPLQALSTSLLAKNELLPPFHLFYSSWSKLIWFYVFREWHNIESGFLNSIFGTKLV